MAKVQFRVGRLKTTIYILERRFDRLKLKKGYFSYKLGLFDKCRESICLFGESN